MTAIVPSGAREISASEHQERVDIAVEIEERIKDNIAVGREALWELAKNLYEFNEESGWTALGYETQQEWLAQPEIGMTRSGFFRLVRKWKELVVNRQIPQETLMELEPSKVDIVMPALENGKTKIDDVLEDVRTLGARDLREMYVKHSQDKPKKAPIQDDDGRGDETTMDGSVIDVTATPVKASDIKLESDKDSEKLVHAIGVVESWMELGGDKRKAQRAWPKVVELLPFFQSLRTVEAAIEGGPDAPDRKVAARAWKHVQATLHLTVEAS